MKNFDLSKFGGLTTAILRGKSQTVQNGEFTDAELIKILTTVLDLVEFGYVYITTKQLPYQFILDIVFNYGSPKNFIEQARTALAQFKKLNPTRAKYVNEQIKQGFDIDNNELERKIENGLDLIVEAFTLVDMNINFIKKVNEYVTSFKEAKEDSILQNISIA
jgi:hypothetical protein